MRDSRLAELLGVTPGKRVRWERPLLFLLAISTVQIVGRLFLFLELGFKKSAWDASILIAAPWDLVIGLCWAIAFVGIACLAFRIVRFVPLATVATAAAAAASVHLVQQAVLRAQRANLPIFDLERAGSTALWMLTMLLGLEIGLRLIRRRSIALLVGAWAGVIVFHLVLAGIGLITKGAKEPLSPQLLHCLTNIGRQSLLALVLAVGLTVASPDQEGQEISFMSPGFFTGSILAVDWIVLLLTAQAIARPFAHRGRSRDELAGELIVSAMTLVLLVFRAAVFGVWLYRVWGAIQDGGARLTPGRAVGLLFVPFFNLYWVFQAVAGIPWEYVAFAQRQNIDQGPLPEHIFRRYVWLIEATLLPFIGISLLIVLGAAGAIRADEAGVAVIALVAFGALVAIAACLLEVPMLRLACTAANRARARVVG